MVIVTDCLCAPVVIVTDCLCAPLAHVAHVATDVQVSVAYLTTTLPSTTGPTFQSNMSVCHVLSSRTENADS